MGHLLLLLCLAHAQAQPGNANTTTTTTTTSTTTTKTTSTTRGTRSTADDKACMSSLTEAIVTLQVRAFNKLKEQLGQKEDENSKLRQELEDMKLSSVKEAQEHDEGMERQKIECEEKTDELKVSHKNALYSKEWHTRTLVTAHNHETANLTTTFTEELLEQTEMKTALEKNLEGSEELVAFLLTVLEESKDTMSELEGLITEQGNKILEVIIDHEGFREKEKSFYKSVRNSTSASKTY